MHAAFRLGRRDMFQLFEPLEDITSREELVKDIIVIRELLDEST